MESKKVNNENTESDYIVVYQLLYCLHITIWKLGFFGRVEEPEHELHGSGSAFFSGTGAGNYRRLWFFFLLSRLSNHSFWKIHEKKNVMIILTFIYLILSSKYILKKEKITENETCRLKENSFSSITFSSEQLEGYWSVATNLVSQSL